MSEVVLATVVGILKRLSQHLWLEQIIAHGNVCMAWPRGNGDRALRLFLKILDSTTCLRNDHSEGRSRVHGNRYGCNRGICTTRLMELRHLPDIHPIDMISGEDSHHIWFMPFHDMEVLVDSVSRASEAIRTSFSSREKHFDR